MENNPNTIKIVELSYNPRDIIGRGGFANVYKGFYSSSTQVAIKRVQRNYGEDESSIIQREVGLMKTAGVHSNIVGFIHTEMTADFVFIAMELCRGTLQEYVEGTYNGPKFESEREILFQITQGLAHLHGLNIVHRDIKPTNILIYVPTTSKGTADESQPQIKLADFGRSKITENDFTETSMSNPRGTRGWMAPEVYLSKRVDYKVDIFPLGLIFAYTLSEENKHPFGDNPDVRVVEIRKKGPIQMVRNDLKKLYSEDDQAFNLVKSMLVMNPDERPTVQDIQNSLFFPVNRQKLFKSILSSFENNKGIAYSIDHFKKLLIHDDLTDVNVKLKSEYTLLHILCDYYKEDNLIDLVQLLIDKGVKVNIKHLRMTPLHKLCENYGKDQLKNIFQLLIDQGAKVNTKDIQNGSTPLHSLCWNFKHDNLIDIVRLLIEKGADINAKNKNGWTPLHSLCLNYKNDNLMDIAQLFIKNGADVNAIDEHGNTPLHELCRNYNNDNLKDIVQLLVERGAEVNTKNKDEWTPLHFLCSNYNNDNLMDIAQLLVERGAEINAKTIYDGTPLHYLCNNYKSDDLIDIVQLLIKNGADINAKNYDGDTPLHNLCRNYNNGNLMDIVQFFIEKGARANEKNNEKGETPLHVLCRCYKIDGGINVEDNLRSLVSLFENNGADINEKDDSGTTPHDHLINRKKTMLAMESTNRAAPVTEDVPEEPIITEDEDTTVHQSITTERTTTTKALPQEPLQGPSSAHDEGFIQPDTRKRKRSNYSIPNLHRISGQLLNAVSVPAQREPVVPSMLVPETGSIRPQLNPVPVAEQQPNGFISPGAPSQSGYNQSLYNEYSSAYFQSPSMFMPGPGPAVGPTMEIPPPDEPYHSDSIYSRSNSYQEEIAAQSPNMQYYEQSNNGWMMDTHNQ